MVVWPGLALFHCKILSDSDVPDDASGKKKVGMKPADPVSFSSHALFIGKFFIGLWFGLVWLCSTVKAVD